MEHDADWRSEMKGIIIHPLRLAALDRMKVLRVPFREQPPEHNGTGRFMFTICSTRKKEERTWHLMWTERIDQGEITWRCPDCGEIARVCV